MFKMDFFARTIFFAALLLIWKYCFVYVRTMMIEMNEDFFWIHEAMVILTSIYLTLLFHFSIVGENFH